jgi:hypothetical protein
MSQLEERIKKAFVRTPPISSPKQAFRNPIQFILSCSILLLLTQPVYSGTVTVTNISQLVGAVGTANGSQGNTTILLQDGTYTLSDTLYVKAPNVTLAGVSGNRDNVVIQGDAMSSTAKVKNLLRVSASNFKLRDLTLQRCGWHLIQIVGEENADYPIINNCILRDAYEQILKGSVDQNNIGLASDSGLIENCLFEYSAGIGPQYYIGGIDVHGGKNWIVRNNIFHSIISPTQTVAEHAVHFWNGSADNIVEKNLFINCDRAIGFGLDGRGNTRGIIRNNMIYHAANAGQFADVSIYLVESPGTEVYNNTIFMENSYPRSIEYRFSSTTSVLIVNNLLNKPIGARDGASGTVGSNVENAIRSWFLNPGQGDLHLAAGNTVVVDAGRVVSDLVEDYDGDKRPQGIGFDIGADEWSATPSSQPSAPRNLHIVQ